MKCTTWVDGLFTNNKNKQHSFFALTNEIESLSAIPSRYQVPFLSHSHALLCLFFISFYRSLLSLSFSPSFLPSFLTSFLSHSSLPSHSPSRSPSHSPSVLSFAPSHSLIPRGPSTILYLVNQSTLFQKRANSLHHPLSIIIILVSPTLHHHPRKQHPWLPFSVP